LSKVPLCKRFLDLVFFGNIVVAELASKSNEQYEEWNAHEARSTRFESGKIRLIDKVNKAHP
jgi:hypothetical protein